VSSDLKDQECVGDIQREGGDCIQRAARGNDTSKGQSGLGSPNVTPRPSR
jgi:hypothetical protein